MLSPATVSAPADLSPKEGQYSESYGHPGSGGKIGNLTSKGGVSYGYNDGAHKHAVTHLGGDQKYWYDGNPTPLRIRDCAAT